MRNICVYIYIYIQTFWWGKSCAIVLMETLETHLCNRRQCHLSKAMTPVIILLWTVKLWSPEALKLRQRAPASCPARWDMPPFSCLFFNLMAWLASSVLFFSSSRLFLAMRHGVWVPLLSHLPWLPALIHTAPSSPLSLDNCQQFPRDAGAAAPDADAVLDAAALAKKRLTRTRSCPCDAEWQLQRNQKW